jgi:hypothetical protein
MEYRFRLANGLPATLHWLSDKAMREVAEACHKHLVLGANAYAAFEISFEGETVYLVGICDLQTSHVAAEVAEFWSKDAEAVDRACLLVCNGVCYRLDRSKRGQLIMAGLKKGLPPGVCLLIEEDIT